MTSFFPPHTNLGVGKHHVLGNKIWGTLGDALMTYFRVEEWNFFFKKTMEVVSQVVYQNYQVLGA